MASAETAAKARISKLLKNIEAAGLEAPTFPDDMGAVEREQILKNFWAENKPMTDESSSIRAKADLLGIPYDAETSDEAISTEIKQVEAELRARSRKHMEERHEAAAEKAAVDASAMAELAKQVGVEVGRAIAKKEEGAERIVNSREYDPGDITEPKTYFTTSAWWKVPMKRRGGQLVAPPFGKMMFKLLEGESVRVGARNQVRFLSAYTTDSKAEQAYLETHELFNKVFFLSEDRARMSAEDTQYALKFGEINSMLLTYQAPDIYRLAGSEEMRSEGVSLSKDMSLETIRTELAGAMARRAIREDKERRLGLLGYEARKDLLATT